MKVVITNNAYNDINEFINISQSNSKVLKNYITALLTFTFDLGDYPEMGKYTFSITTKLKKYDIRQLIFKQHKILYYVDDAIHIVGIMHTKANHAEYLKKLKKFI